MVKDVTERFLTPLFECCAKISASVVDGAALWIGSVGTLTPIENNYSQKGGLEKGLEVNRL